MGKPSRYVTGSSRLAMACSSMANTTIRITLRTDMEKAYVNYYKKSLEILDSLPKGEKPSLLLHACCGPCSCFPLTFLCPHFEVTIYFNNSNIFTESEYLRRLEELKKFIA